MKTTLPACSLLVALLFLPGCGGKQAPSMDIWTAAATGDTETIQAHIDYGTDLDGKEPSNGSTPLIVAALFGHTPSMELLVHAGADVNLLNNDNSSALHTAAFFCRTEAVQMLLENGARTDLRNHYGQTPVETVSAEWSEDVAGVYTMFSQSLGIPVDLERIEATRPQIKAMIEGHGEG
jgi:ankyrin repeat protein